MSTHITDYDSAMTLLRALHHCDGLNHHDLIMDNNAEMNPHHGFGLPPDEKDILFRVRTAFLDEWSNQEPTYPKQQTNGRNMQLPGGSITADVLTIQRFAQTPDQEERVAKWKEGFSERYGISFNLIEPQIYNAPPWLLLAMNRRATVYSMQEWQNSENKDVRSRIIDNADKIIKEWCKSNVTLTIRGPEIEKWSNEIEDDYLQGVVSLLYPD